MDSPDPRPEAGPLTPRHRRAWLVAIVLWTAFLGAMLDLVAGLLLLPPEVTHDLDWHALSVLFLGGWLVMLVPTGFAVALALPLCAPPPVKRDGD